MLYSEFIEGTGCRDNDTNFRIYQDLEVMYMNSNLSKQQIYEYGKKLVDNSDSPEEVAIKEQVKAEMAEHKEQLASYRRCLKQEREHKPVNKPLIDYYKKQVAYYRRQVALCKWVLEV